MRGTSVKIVSEAFEIKSSTRERDLHKGHDGSISVSCLFCLFGCFAYRIRLAKITQAAQSTRIVLFS